MQKKEIWDNYISYWVYFDLVRVYFALSSRFQIYRKLGEYEFAREFLDDYTAAEAVHVNFSSWL